jgi:hypothetical protein
MEVQNFTRVHGAPVSERGFQNVGRFTVEVTPDVRIYDWLLVLTPDGRYQAYAPAGKKTSHVIAVAPAARAAIAKQAARYMDNAANDQHH